MNKLNNLGCSRKTVPKKKKINYIFFVIFHSNYFIYLDCQLVRHRIALIFKKNQMFLHKPFLVKKVSKYFRIQFKHLFLFLYKALSLCLCQGKLYMGTIIQLFKELHYNLEAINKANTSKTIFSKHYTHISWIISKLPAHRTLLFFLKKALLFMQQLNKSSRTVQ